MKYKKICLLAIVSTLGACGGGGDSDEASGSITVPSVATRTGVFLDSPVINIDYATATRSGVTNSSGEYEYLPDETVTFSIGDLAFPAATAVTTLTPLNLVGTADTTDTEVVNILRLLQTLDQDANPNNGITINDTAKATATQVNFELSEADFASSGAVSNLIFNAGQDSVVTGLVPAADALAHFETVLEENEIVFNTLAELEKAIITTYLSDNNLVAEAHESGLYFQILEEGTGGNPTQSSTVEVEYTGMLLDGTVFDQTTNGSTAQFPLTNLITGWQIGIPLMQKGGSIILYVPSALAYGSQGSGATIPPNSVLIFEIKLIDFQ